MGIVTQVRAMPSHSNTYRWYQNGYTANNSNYVNTDVYQTGDQITTSYRTGKSDTSDPSGGYTQETGSQIGFLRELAAENRGDLGRSLWDTGHEFTTEKWSIVWPPARDIALPNSAYGNLFVKSAMLLPGGNFSYPAADQMAISSREFDGNILAQRTIPAAPLANLAAFVGELREGLPQLVGMSTVVKGQSIPRSAADEYLNLEFGIKPFIKDLRGLAQSVLHAHALIDRLNRDSSKPIHKKARLEVPSFSRSRPELVSYLGVQAPPFFQTEMANQIYAASTPITCEEFYTGETWFSGGWSYLLAQNDEFLGRLNRFTQQAEYLLGNQLTVDVIWELTPWSWLFDWFTGIGHYVASMELLASDNRVMRYGYVMHKRKCVRIYTMSGLQPLVGVDAPTTLQVFFSHEKKTRVRASPYGFGLSLDGLSDKQWSILGALGLTKAPRSLR